MGSNPVSRAKPHRALAGLVHWGVYTMPTARSHERTLLPVVDLFAGPGGLGEGFSALDHDRARFDVVLSVEKDPAAHRTLRLRALFRHLRTDYQREAYYLYL